MLAVPAVVVVVIVLVVIVAGGGSSGGWTTAQKHAVDAACASDGGNNTECPGIWRCAQSAGVSPGTAENELGQELIDSVQTDWITEAFANGGC